MKLGKHIVNLRNSGYSISILCNVSVALHALRANQMQATRVQVRCALKRIVQTPYFDLHYGRAFRCDCANPTLHLTDACLATIAREDAGIRPTYYCSDCELYGDDRYA